MSEQHGRFTIEFDGYSFVVYEDNIQVRRYTSYEDCLCFIKRARR